MKGKERNKRQSVNAVSLLVTCLFLFLAVQFSDGGGLFATKINKITENLDKAVLELNGNVSYSNYHDKSEYVSSTKFHASGMAGLYNLTNLFIDIISPKDILMKGLITIDPRNNIIIRNPDPIQVLTYYPRIVALTLFVVLCIVLFPFCGMCVCCCRCCGKCGARRQTADKKKDTCKKVIQASLLIVCGTGLLFCVVCAFGSNQQLQDGIDNFPSNMNNSIKDTKTFMDSTNSELKHLLVNNYQEFSDTFNAVMDNSTAVAMEQLVIYSNASAVSEICQFADNLGNIKESLYSLKSNTNKLRVYASQLNDAIRKVKRDLTKTLQDCHSESCNEIKKNINNLQTSIDFNSVPDVSDTISSFDNLEIDKIQIAAQSANKSLYDISTNIENGLRDGVSAAKQQIAKTATTIKQNLDSFTRTVRQVKSQIDTNTSPVLKTAQDYINKYGKYRYYVGLTISCALLLVTVCIMFGLICGICGKRPDGYSDNCCNKGAGGQFLICAVMFMFLFGFLISVITLVSLLVGVVSEKAICDPFRDPDPIDYTVIKLLDDIKLDLGVDIKPSTMLNYCYRNKSIYQTLNLEDKFHLDEIKQQFDISEQLNKFDIEHVIDVNNFRLLDDTQRSNLEKLKLFTPNIDVDKFTDELQGDFTTYNISELSTSLADIISKLSDSQAELKSQLQLSLLHLHTYDEKLITPMKQLANSLMITSTQLSEELKMNKTSFTVAISDLINEIDTAQTALIEDGPNNLKKIADSFKKVIENLVNGYINRVSHHVKNEIGQCGPLNLVIHASLTSTCEKVLLPWNGFWFSLFCTIVLYIVTIIISIKLANLYQKHKPPYEQYVETEYLYDAYADRGDNIPLNSRGAKKGKKKGKKPKRTEPRPSASVAREYASGSHPSSDRYDDMARKHWEDFPNGGPPHYQRAPTEYERPPPYYYPGSGGD